MAQRRTWSTPFQFDATNNEWVRIEAQTPYTKTPASAGSLGSGDFSPTAPPTQGLRRFYVLLCLAAAITCLLSFINDIVISEALKLRGKLLWLVNSSVGGFDSLPLLELSAFLALVMFKLTFAGLAHLVSRSQPMSFGSGIPEIRCELQKTHMEGFFESSVLRAKLIGLMLAEASGLSIGKEGPFVHCAAVISQKLSSMKCFKPVQKIPDFMGHLMAVSISVGAVSVFGVPIGGVLFAIEVMPNSASGNMTYWSCIAAASAGSLVLRVVPVFVQGPIVNLIPPIDRSNMNDSLTESTTLLTLAVPLGLICGLLGALFVQVQTRLSIWIREWISGRPCKAHMHIMESTWQQMDRNLSKGFLEEEDTIRTARRKSEAAPVRKPHSALLVVLAVTFLDACVTFTVPLLRGTNLAALLWELVSKSELEWGSTSILGTNVVPPLPHDWIFDYWSSQPWSALVMHFVVTVALFFVTALSLSIPIPAGCISPSYIVGALSGRCYGHVITLLELLLIGHSTSAKFYPSLALIGATAYTAAVCRSFSVVIAVFELVGGGELLLPLTAASIISIFVANNYSPSIFEAIASAKSLPTLSQPRSLLDGWEPISAVMDTDVALVPESLGEDAAAGRAYLEQVLRDYPGQTDFAVVEGTPETVHSAPLIGTARRSAVRALAATAEVRISSNAAGGGGGGEEPPPPLKLCRDDLWVAQQMHGTRAVRYAQLSLENHPGRDIFVTQGGRVLGVVNFNTLLDHDSLRQSGNHASCSH